MITSYKKFIEAISGTELVGNHMGPGYPEQINKANTLNQSDTDVILSRIDDKIYTYDDYQMKYHEYLKLGGEPLNGFNQTNLKHVLLTIKSSKEES